MTPIQAQIDFSIDKTSTSPLLDKMHIKVNNGDYENITSILIVKDGNLVYEKYYNGADKNSLHNTRSATKTIATLLTGVAIDKGFIKSEKDKILDHLKFAKPLKNDDERKANITIEDLLTMSSILECDDGNYFSRGNEERMYHIENWPKFFADLPIKAYPFGPKPEELPFGRSFSYCTAGAATVAEIVKTVIEGDLDSFYKKNILDPLEITNYKLHYTPMGTINTAGGSEYTSRDFTKFIQLLMNEGRWNGDQLISAEWIQKASTPKVNARENVDYGYLLWIESFGKSKKYNSFYMSGNGGNRMHAFPELGLCAIVTTTNYNNRNAHGYVNEILNEYIVPAFEEN